MSQATEVVHWKGNIQRGTNFRQRFYKDSDWLRFEKYFQNIHQVDGKDYDPKADPTERSMVIVNLIATIGRMLVNQVYYRNPHIFVRPQRAEHAAGAVILQNIINAIIRKVGVKHEMRMAIQDAYTLGTAIIKEGYDSEFGLSTDVQNAAEPLEASDTSEGKKGERIEYRTNIFPGFPWAIRVHPADFVVPYDTRELASARWACHAYTRALEDVKADPKFSSAGLEADTELAKRLSQGSLTEGTPGTDTTGAGSELPEIVRLYEIHDLRKKRVRVFAYNHKKWLRDDPNILIEELGRLPFQALIFNPQSRYFWGISDVHTIEQQQWELNDIRTQDAKQRRISIMKFLYDAELIDEDELEKLVSEQVGAGVKCKGNPREAVAFVQPHQGPDMMTAAKTVQEDIRAQVGFSRIQMGEQLSGRRTAKEVGDIGAAFDVGISAKRDRVNDILINTARDMAELVFAFWRVPRIATRVPRTDGSLRDVLFTGPELRGEYDFVIGAEDSAPVNRAERKRELMELLGALKGIEGADIKGLLGQMLPNLYEGLDSGALFAGAGAEPQPFSQFAQGAGSATPDVQVQ